MISHLNSRKEPSKVTCRVPEAWLRCSMCLGTGYAFSPSTSAIKANVGGAMATMTNSRCETCRVSGSIPYLDRLELSIEGRILKIFAITRAESSVKGQMYNLLRLVSLSALLDNFLYSLLKVGKSIDELKSSVTSFLISSYLFIKSRENCLTRKLKLELVPLIRNPAIFYSSTDI